MVSAADEGHGGGEERDVVEMAEEQRTAGRGAGRGKKTRATVDEVRDDRGRCGAAMAARTRELWEGGTHAGGRQGCAACCTRKGGWGWRESPEGRWEWRGGLGEEPAAATLVHVMCGECEGVDPEVRGVQREAIRKSLQDVRKAVTRKGVRGAPCAIEWGRDRLVRSIDAAQRALAKREGRARAQETRALTDFLAGRLPHVYGTNEGRMRNMGKRVVGSIRAAQRAAATLRSEWHEAGKEEKARRATREGGAEGTRWRGVGLSAWRQSHQAIVAEEEAEGGGEGEREGEGRHGWTMAAALIWYKQRQAEKAARTPPAEVTPARADARGEGVVVFDVETTTLVGEGELEGMEVSVACAARLPASGSVAKAMEEAERGSFWHASVRRAPGGGEAASVETLLAWMDTARMIVAYNGAEFDMRVLWRYYQGDEERWQSHMAKLHDPMRVIWAKTGRRIRLSTMLRWNGIGGKAGAGCDAPRWWEEGRWQYLEEYCARDVWALVELVARTEVKVASHTHTADVSVRHMLAEERGGAADDAPPAAGSRGTKRPHSYDEVQRRKTRRTGSTHGYMERGSRRGGGGQRGQR